VRHAGLGALLLAAPLLLAAARDPRGDVATCDGGTPVTDPAVDLVGVRAFADELGSAAVWRLTFAAPIVVPDPTAPPLRIDVLVRDPRLPVVSLGDERGINRIVRWNDTAADAPIDILWVPAQGHTPFNPPVIEGRTIEIRVPGRILVGEAPNGTESVARARWSVLVRDGAACDRLGDRPTLRLEAPPPSPASTVPPAPPTGGSAEDSPRPNVGGLAVVVAAVLLIPAVAIALILRRRSR
jgi:hypothetical protein